MNNIRYFGPLHKIDKWLKKSAAMFVNSSSYAWCSGPTSLGDSEPIWRKRHYFKKIDLLAFLLLFGCPNLGEREETNIFNVKNPFCPLDCPPCKPLLLGWYFDPKDIPEYFSSCDESWRCLKRSVSQMILGWYFDQTNISESECLCCHIWISVILE